MMFSRALLVALCTVYATSLTPLAPLGASADDDCALYLTGPGRSSAYDYSLNLLKGNFAYDGQHTCITYEAINQAYLDARNRILVSHPKGDWKAEDFASVGELILDISISLARTYGLTYEEIEKGLPLIDTSRTLIREVCPPVFSHVECRAGKYRRLDGLCNNLKHPTWGATMAPFQRLIGPLFSDGINAPRISHTGRDLPLSRVVSRTMHPDEGFHDHAGTVMVIAWGQFMDHDYTLTGTPLDPVNRNDPEECCKRPLHLKHPYCNEIRVPDDDYFYRLFGVKCIDFVRGFPSPRPGCRLGSRIPFNTLTGVIDGNTVYGVTEKFSRKLRTGYGGFLRMNPVFKEYGLKDLLPLKLDIPDEGCTRPNKNMYCFEAGEIRVNEQLVLTVMHTLMAREHNRVAEALAHVNPHWDDESLFQEARRINIAEIQHITYNEFLPILLGKDVMEKFGLVLAKEGYWEGYDEAVNPDVIASFAAAAYRFGHSLLPTAVERWSKAHKFIASKRLSDLIRRPYDLYRAGVLDEYVMGLMNQVAQAMDDSITQEVTNHLFKKVGARFGMDLVSFNMQRGREFGLPGYMEFRKFCGLSGAETFQDLFGSMPNETVRKYESIFEHPIDVDLWSGGVSERPLAGSMLGPTFACIIATQFSYSRRGDRFWFELPNQPSSFTPEQLAEIRKARLARVICDNTDIIDTVQLYPMVLPDHELNPRVPCRSGIIPSMDFSKWADPVPFLGGAKEYMTSAYSMNGTTKQNNKTDKICNNINENCVSSNSLDKGNNTNTITTNVNKSDNKCLHAQSTTDCLNNENKNNCKEQNCTNGTLNQNEGLDNKINDRTATKYVNKKGDHIVASEKLKGHFKNSLKRKKRSFHRDNEGDGETNVPGIYDVIKAQNIERGELKLPKVDPSAIIKNSDIADYHIETIHKSNKPDHTKVQRGEQRHYNPINKNNNDQLPDSEEDDKYGTFNEESSHENQGGESPITHTQKQEYRGDTNSKVYLPKLKDFSQESEEINVRGDTRQENSPYQDENYNRSNENYKRGESENKKPLNNILTSGNIRYYPKDKKNKYHISNPKKVADQSNENDSQENIEEEDSSLENDDDNHSKKFREDTRLNGYRKQPKTLSENRKGEFHDDNIKHTDKENFSYQEDENDEEPDKSFESDENSHGYKQQPDNNLRTKKGNYNNYKSHLPASNIPDDFSDETKKGKDTHDDYEDDVDDDEPIENLKKDRSSHSNKPSTDDDILEKHNQKYNDNRNKYFSSRLKNQNEDSNEEEDEDDNESNENYKNDKNINEHKLPNNSANQQYSNVKNNNYLPGPEKLIKESDESYERKHNNYLPGPEKLNKESDESYERKDNRKENRYQDKGDVDDRTENYKDDRGTKDIKQLNNVLPTRNQVYHYEKNEYPLLESKKSIENSKENYEQEGKNKENEYKVDSKGPLKNYNTNDRLLAFTKETPLHSYKTTNSERENNEDNHGGLKYTNHPINSYSEITVRPAIRITPNYNTEKQHFLSDDSTTPGNTKLYSSSNENFGDNRQKETQVLNENIKQGPKIQETLDKPQPIQELPDFSDFSYDKFRGLSDVGKFAPANDLHENYGSVFATITTSTNKPKLKKKNKSAKIKKPKKITNQVYINRGKEIPVTELNYEHINEENKKNLNENLSGNLVKTMIPKRKTNVKKQFQRIPIDYNHAGSKSTKNSLSGKNTESEGTLDTLSPVNNKYDEHLKKKFDDINIKLPEIKLPEDILAYTKESQENSKDKSKIDYFNYHDNAQYSEKPKPQENSETIYDPYDPPTNAKQYSELRKPKADKSAQEYDFFASYINKPNEDNKSRESSGNSDIEDGEDLYERFVRERFGKKDSFKERSVKLKDKNTQENKPTTKNKELFENLQKALKKAEKVQKEAQKSLDPNASYLWTLEYGEKL